MNIFHIGVIIGIVVGVVVVVIGLLVGVDEPDFPVTYPNRSSPGSRRFFNGPLRSAATRICSFGSGYNSASTLSSHLAEIAMPS